MIRGKMEDREFLDYLRFKLKRWAETTEGKEYAYRSHIEAAPEIFQLLCRLAVCERLESADKELLFIATAYFVAPYDVIPEVAVGPRGFIDDVAMAAYALELIANRSAEGRTFVADRWEGETPLWELVDAILADAPTMCGPESWEKVRARLAEFA